MKRALGPLLALAAVLAYAACDRVVDLTPPPQPDASFRAPDAPPFEDAGGDAAPDAAEVVLDAPSD